MEQHQDGSLAGAPGDAPGGAPAAGEGADLLQKYPVGRPLEALDGADVRELFRSAYEWLARNAEQVNRLNVFPVPDGDTGTNMLLTLKSAWASVAQRGGPTVAGVVGAAAEGAHHGSRGNSGVILGQMIRALSAGLAHVQQLTARDLAAALAQAAEAAYKSVPVPVEGTILTVAREVAAAAERAAAHTADIRAVVRQMVEAADSAVRRTPEMLPVLKKAGVVDSGGKGLYFFFEGWLRALMGQDSGEGAAALVEQIARDEKGYRPIPPTQWGFDVQFLVERPRRSADEIRAAMLAIGDSVLVEGDERLVKVHVHLFDPGVALSLGVNLGFISDVVVENMDDMAAAAQIGAAEEAALPVAADLSLAVGELDEEGIGLVAVSPGAGFTEIFHNLGVHAVVSGGQTMNPSIADLADAVLTLPSRRVLILPNNSNIILAAGQVARLLEERGEPRRVGVLRSRTLPQGIAALLSFDPRAEDLEALVGEMAETMEAVQTGEVTQAVRDAELDGLEVRTGEFIGLLDGKLVEKGEHLNDITFALLKRMNAAKAEIVTLYYGGFVAANAAENLAVDVREEYPDQEVELAYGGQPHYFYILSVE